MDNYRQAEQELEIIHDKFRDEHTRLDDVCKSWEYDFNNDDENYIFVDGVRYPYEMTLSPEVPDDMCSRVKINGKYYYFGD